MIPVLLHCTDSAHSIVVVVVVVLTLTRIIKSVVTGQAPVTLELRNTPGKNTHNPYSIPEDVQFVYR